MKRNQSGFTLIEIAIVLVIIGLLLGGVLKGQELINSAKVKNLAGDFKTSRFISIAIRINSRPCPVMTVLLLLTYPGSWHRHQQALKAMASSMAYGGPQTRLMKATCSGSTSVWLDLARVQRIRPLQTIFPGTLSGVSLA